MKKILWGVLPLMIMAGSIASCSDDDNEYRSEPPLLSDLSVKVLKQPASSEIHVGDRVVVTAEQSKKGRLLNATTYGWSSTPTVAHRFTKSVIYDKQPVNPTDTVVFDKPGQYTLRFEGKYNASGNTHVWSNKHGVTFTQDFASGDGRVTYQTGSLIYFKVIATKQMTVLP